MENANRIGELIFKSLNEELTPEERRELDDWRDRPGNARLFEALIARENLREGLRSAYAAREAKERVYARVLKEKPARRGKDMGRIRRIHRRNRWVAAAVLLAVIAGGGYWWRDTRTKKGAVVSTARANAHDVAPGGNRAVLTLANGTRIVLDSLHAGFLASQGNTKIVKTGSGLLRYQAAGTSSSGSAAQMTPPAGSPGHAPGKISYNTLATPRGGEYRLVLPDGTKVWLNAASSIRYPTSFSGHERLVELTGEAYFEVVHDPRQPFRVKAGNTVVKDLGTHFNINAYADEPLMKVTLLEGSVSVSRGNGTGGSERERVALHPGQQAQVPEQGNIRLVNHVNTEKETAWKNGLFYFREIGIQELMKRLGRWYDIRVEYAAGYRDTYHFTGEISRHVPISRVLEMVEQTGVARFDVTGKTVTVLPGIPIPPLQSRSSK